jgi:hypothetical protein
MQEKLNITKGVRMKWGKILDGVMFVASLPGSA